MNTCFMKYKKVTRGILFILFGSIMMGSQCLSQGTEVDIIGKRPAYLGWNIGPVLNHYTINVNPGITTPVISSEMTLFSSIEAGYLFTRHFGASLGFGISSVATNLTMESLKDQFDARDSELEIYERRIQGSDIREKQKISFLNIPLQLNLQGSLSRSVGFYIQSGVNISFPVKKSYNSTGTFTYSGYYHEYNVLIKDIIYEGFQSSVKNDVTGILHLKTVIPEFISSAGLQFFLQKRLQFSTGIIYSKLLGNPSDYDPGNTFRISTYPGQMQSMMEGAEIVSTGSVGMKIAFRYYL